MKYARVVNSRELKTKKQTSTNSQHHQSTTQAVSTRKLAAVSTSLVFRALGWTMWETVWKGIVILSIVTVAKVLLVPAYHSTDYDVHRFWLGLTHNTEASTWYTDTTSVWTLDYPPLFAWFEAGVASVLAPISPCLVAHTDDATSALCLDSDPGSKPAHRASVMVADLVLLAGAVYALVGLWNPFPPPGAVLFSPSSTPSLPRKTALAEGRNDVITGLSGTMGPMTASLVLILASPALLLLDHVHFQYNGMLTGVLLVAVGGITSRSGYALTAAAFATLLGLKHLYLVLAPVFTVFLFRAAVVAPVSGPVSVPGAYSLSGTRFAVLAGIVIVVLGATFGPWLVWGKMGDVVARLFPFKRGLVHAYWAPNMWALYAAGEVALGGSGSPGLTSGIVGNVSFGALPNITPVMTGVLSLCLVGISVAKVWLTTPAGALITPPRSQSARIMRYLQRPAVVFIHGLVESSLGVFLFGWHVHEKALIVPLLPLALLAPTSPRYAGMFAFLQAVTHVALFPLFPPGMLTPIKIGLVLAYSAFIRYAFKPYIPQPHLAYLFGLVVVVGLSSFSPVLFPAYVFLPTMLVSVYCAVGVVMAYVWILLY